MSVGVIVTMAIVTVASSVTERIMEATGKHNIAEYLNMATVSGMAATALTIFASAVKALRMLG